MPVLFRKRSGARPKRRLPARRALITGAVTAAAGLLLAVATGDFPPSSAASISAASTLSSTQLSTTRANVRSAPRLADFGLESPSPDTRHLADWIAHTRDNQNAEFIVVDKRDAKAYVFDADARLRGASPVLLGAAVGDETVPGIGSRPIAQVRPEERTTPAGRFVAERGRNLKGEDVVWVDYDAAVSMHRVRATKPAERRLERLATPTVDDNRISYGCINVPVAFYETYVRPTVATHRAIVYVLPEGKPVQQVFGSYEVNPRRHATNRVTALWKKLLALFGVLNSSAAAR